MAKTSEVGRGEARNLFIKLLASHPPFLRETRPTTILIYATCELRVCILVGSYFIHYQIQTWAVRITTGRCHQRKRDHRH